MVRVNVQKTGPVDVDLPAYATRDCAGLDLQAALAIEEVLAPGERRLIPTGLRLALPSGYEAQVRPRSGLALRLGLTVLNTPGTIDADYRGEVKVLLINLGQEAARISPKMRIAQLVVAPVLKVDLQLVTELDETDRGQGGYGSTGV